jgi:hypothetical protein
LETRSFKKPGIIPVVTPLGHIKGTFGILHGSSGMLTASQKTTSLASQYPLLALKRAGGICSG